MQNLYIGRKVALASAACSLILGLLPIIANADWRSTAGIIAAIGGLALVAQKWLDGLQKHEARVSDAVLTRGASGVNQINRVYATSGTTANTAFTYTTSTPAEDDGEPIARELGIHAHPTAERIPRDLGDTEAADKDKP